MSEYFYQYKLFRGNVKVELDLYNYATKADLKGATDFDTCNLAAKSDLASLKAKADKMDIDKKLITAPADLSKLSNVVDNDIIKKTVYDKVVTEVNTIVTGSTLIDLNPDEYNQGLCYYSFMVNLYRCNESCSTLDDLSNRTCILNKIEDVNLSVFNMLRKNK